MRDIIQLLEQKSKPQDIEIIKRNFTDSEVSPGSEIYSSTA